MNKILILKDNYLNQSKKFFIRNIYKIKNKKDDLLTYKKRLKVKKLKKTLLNLVLSKLIRKPQFQYLLYKSKRKINYYYFLNRINKIKYYKNTSATIHILSTENNTIVSATNNKGGVIMWTSGGIIGLKGSKRGSSYAAYKIGRNLAKKNIKKRNI